MTSKKATPESDSRELHPLKTSSITDPEQYKASPPCLWRVREAAKGNILILLILGGVLLGICLGFGLRESRPSEDLLMWIGLPGELFLRSLKATIVPLVICMVITCTASLDPKSNGKIAVVGSLGFLGTQLMSSSISVLLFFAFRPGEDKGDRIGAKNYSTDLQTQDVFADLIRNIFPDNVVSATFSQVSTVHSEKTKTVVMQNETFPNQTYNFTVLTRSRGLDTTGGTNILGLILVCSVVGIAAGRALRPDCEFLAFFRQAQQVIFLLIRWLFWTTPIGVLSLITVSIAAVENIHDVFVRLAMLVASVCLGLTLYVLLVIPGLLLLVRRTNPVVFLSRCVRPAIIAFASTATAVAMPDMLTSCDCNGVNAAVSTFVIPMSVTLHADGSALYITAASLFVAQSSGVGLGPENIFIIGTMSGILSLAIPPVPSSSIVTIVIILSALGYPLQDVALLFAVEWLLDRLRSAVTAIGHVVVAALTDTICTKALNMDIPAQSGRDHLGDGLEDVSECQHPRLGENPEVEGGKVGAEFSRA